MDHPIRVLVVDDSPFIRHVLTKYLEADPDIVVVGEARDGMDALIKIPALKPDVITLDVEMPRMDGLATLQRIMAQFPTPVVMLSALTQRGARITIQALMWGAVDFVSKPAAAVGIYRVIEELSVKIKVAARSSPSSAAPLLSRPSKLGPQPFRSNDALVIICASTGGPRALQQIFSGLPADLSAAVVAVQHMPPGFTQSLAQRLNEKSTFTVQEAAQGDRLARGLALLVPGDYHLQFARDKRITLDQGPRRNHLRPAADVSMESAAAHYGSAVLGVILTGMGSDGTDGARRIKAVGGKVIAEHESTSVVYGMPRSVVEAGLADRVVPLPEMIPTLIELLE